VVCVTIICSPQLGAILKGLPVSNNGCKNKENTPTLSPVALYRLVGRIATHALQG